MERGRLPKPQTIGSGFEEDAKAILKAELKRNRLTYAELADRFTKTGDPITEPTLRNKISRGSFNAGFFLHCLALIGTEILHLHSLEWMFNQQHRLHTKSDERPVDNSDAKEPD